MKLLFIVAINIHVASSVLPAYTCALHTNEVRNQDDLISNYFHQGYTNNEIAGFLALQHGIVLSVRTIKRILRRMGLRRVTHTNESPVEEIVRAILEELENSAGAFMGYRQLTRRLRRKYNLNVRRDSVKGGNILIQGQTTYGMSTDGINLHLLVFTFMVPSMDFQDEFFGWKLTQQIKTPMLLRLITLTQ